MERLIIDKLWQEGSLFTAMDSLSSNIANNLVIFLPVCECGCCKIRLKRFSVKDPPVCEDVLC